MRQAAIIAALFLLAAPACADEAAFHTGGPIEGFGPVAKVDADMTIPEGAQFKVRFDIKKAAEKGAVSRNLETAARFINMHAANGVSLEAMDLALVIHGGAVKDVTHGARYKEFTDAANANEPLIAALIANGVRIIVCGQSAAYYDVSNEDLAPGVEMALSAMTAHALLDAEGYSLNPF